MTDVCYLTLIYYYRVTFSVPVFFADRKKIVELAKKTFLPAMHVVKSQKMLVLMLNNTHVP